MYNSFVHKKHNERTQRQQLTKSKNTKWLRNYKYSVRPALVQRYSRRINNFIVRIEQDKKDFYEYRQETQSKAHQLLKQIYRKQKFIGDPTIKLRDISDWASMLSPTERIEKQHNRRIFESKYGDPDIAYRSIASQSDYTPLDSAQFRSREKKKEIHNHHMRFTSKSRSFSQNRKEIKRDAKSIASIHQKAEQQPLKQYQLQRSMTNNSLSDDQVRSQTFSLVSGGDHFKTNNQQVQQSVSNHKHAINRAVRNKNSNKVYFKQVVDLQQNSNDANVKKSLHQILVRFGVSRIKDIKKQAMVQTDNLDSDTF